MKEFIEKLIGRLEEKIEEKCIEAADKGNVFSDYSYKVQAFKEAIEIVNQLAEEYKGGWIPCSERLPEEELKKAKEERGKQAVFPVLATINKVHSSSGKKYKIVSRAFYGCYNDKNFYNACCDRLDVIAWKSLDAPYEPKGE